MTPAVREPSWRKTNSSSFRVVTELLKATSAVKLEDEHEIIAHTAGKLRK